ncbi:MAG TPA: HAD family phosphatase [Saprospiraceae bacterium]|nr:HAD family phosphatase [Saprospiraceae bacterium]
MRYKGIVFDMDGTLIDSEQLHIDSWLYVFDKFQIPLGELDIHQWIGVSDVTISRQLTDMYLDGGDNVLLDEKRHYFRAVAQPNVQVINGVKEGLAQLKDIPMAVATMSSSYEANKSLTSTGIMPYFRGLITANDVERHKPAPDCYLMACKMLGLEPEDCVGIEDSISGIHASKDAGLFTIGVANTLSAEKLLHADLVLSNTNEVMNWLIHTFVV